MSGKFIMEPRVAYLSEFLKEMNEGKIQVPRFQRDLVWEWEQRRDLLCSIYEGLPIGALLIWNTRLQNIKSYEKIGPFPVSPPHGSGSRTYLMDGLQRMSTLYGSVFYSIPISSVENKHEFAKFAVYCDLECDTVDSLFLLESEISSKEREEASYRFMPLNLVFNSKEMLRFQRSIPEEKEDLIDKLELIASAFRNYKIPVVPLETDDQALVTKSFERINSRGTTMSEAHMLNALSYSADFDLLDLIEKERELHLGDRPTWKELDVRFILQLLKTKLGFDPYSKETDKLAKKLGQAPHILSEVFKGIEAMAVFAENHLTIENPNDFPYRLQMLGLASELFPLSLINNNDLLEKLTSWFWISTYTNSFGTTARNSQKSLDDLRGFTNTGKLPWTLNHPPICHSLHDFDVNFKSARIKAWAFALARRLDDGQLDQPHRKLLNTYKGAALVQIGKLRDVAKRPGNCFLCDPSNVKKVKIEELSVDARERHFIDNTAYEYYINGSFDTFSDHREKLMFTWEQEKIITPAAINAGIDGLIRFG